MTPKTKWMLASATVIVAVAVVFLGRGNAGSRATPSSEPAADSLLNIPLEGTVAARQEFVQAYRRGDARHALALYEQYLPRIGANGLREAIKSVYPNCHDEAHDLGKAIFARLRDVGASLESCADACASGCMHGVLMQLFTDTTSAVAADGAHQHSGQLTAADVAAQIPTFCERPAMTRMYSPGDCAHGVGHAAMFLASYDIPAGIDLCENFPSHALRYYCATGAYMEYRGSRRARADYPTRGAFFPCDAARYPAACFRYVMTNTIRWHYAKKGTLEGLEEQCASLSGKYRLGCFHGIGNAHVGRLGRGAVTLAAVCGYGTRDDQTACVEGAMERLGKFTPTIAIERWEALTDWRRGVCETAAKRKMYDMTKSFAMYPR